MAAEYTSIATQEVAANGIVVFTEAPIPCNRGYVIHREGTGTFKLRGLTEQCKARYKITFGGNVSIPTGGTAGDISLALALDGEAIPSTIMTDTSATAGRIFNVSTSIFVDVPRGCCANLSVKNINAQPITVANANLIVERVS